MLRLLIESILNKFKPIEPVVQEVTVPKKPAVKKPANKPAKKVVVKKPVKKPAVKKAK